MSDKVVVRFAPSPTGPLHIGGVRTALYNYLFARQQGGRFILRIEDTDQLRQVAGAEDYIIESLRWLGIKFNEGVVEGGPHQPYRQSERTALGIYREYAEELVRNGKAYLAFDTPEELDAMRERLKEAGSSNQQYNYITRLQMTNSLTLGADEVAKRIERGDPYVVRIKMPRKEEVRFQDAVRDWVVFHTSQLDDKVLLKSDGLPTYHLANVVDDHLMGVTHVIRGEEWLSSTPLHVLLYRELGWAEQMPKFVHLPLILNPAGKGKLSKRHGDKLGFPVFPVDWTDPETGEKSAGFREAGYLPGALLNFLALLGWNPGTEEEVMDLDRLTELFSLDRIHAAGTKFDIEKLAWFNQTYLREMDDAEILPLIKEELQKSNFANHSDSYLIKAIGLMKERVTLLPEFVSDAPFLYKTPEHYDEKMARKQWNEQTSAILASFSKALEKTEDWTVQALTATFEAFVEEQGIGKGKVMAPMRLALTGMAKGPGVFEIAELIGREETLHRLQRIQNELPVQV